MTMTEPSPSNLPPGNFPALEYNEWLVEPIFAHGRKMDELREQHPAFWNSYANGFWTVTRMDQVRFVLQNPQIFSNRSIVPIEPDPPYKWVPIMNDPPLHTKWRQLLAPLFSPAAMTLLEDKVRQRAIEMIEPLVARGKCDFLRDFAWKYPTTIFMELMGLPVEEADQFLIWEDAILHASIEEDPDRSKAYQAMTDVQNYFAELIKERRVNPRNDLVSIALGWKIDGQDIADEDMLGFCLLMFMAGLDTVSVQLSYSFLHLATHDADRERIVNEPSIIPNAIEELLRVYSFVPTGRTIVQDYEMDGCPMRAGDMIHVYIPSACRDPRIFPDADTVDFDRDVNGHIAFGAGPHRCLGSHLARRELRFAMEEWHKRIPNYRLDPSVELLEHGAMLGIEELGLLWDV